MSVRISNGRKRMSGDEGVLPLINIVFLLLIFFMIVGRISAADPFPLNPPTSISETKAQDKGLMIQIAQDGALALNGQVIDDSAFQQAVAALLTETPALEIAVKADAQADADVMIKIMGILRNLGVTQMRLLTQIGEG